jgi:hypothetical protein
MPELNLRATRVFSGLACLASALVPVLSLAQQSSDASQPIRNPATAQEMPEVIVIGRCRGLDCR